MISNTHKHIKRLIEVGMDEKTAEAILDLYNEQTEDLATKSDLSATEQNLNYEIRNVRHEIQENKIVLESKIEATKNELKLEMQELRSDIKSIMNSNKWSMAILIAILTILLTPIIKLHI